MITLRHNKPQPGKSIRILTRRDCLSESASGKPLYDIRRGVMLANSYYVTGTQTPRINPQGWYLSEKFDGIRAVWDGVDLYTRNLTKIAAPDWFIAKLPTNSALDGELYIKHNFFNQTSGYIRQKVPIDARWQQITFRVFDIPSLHMPLEDRLAKLKVICDTVGNPLIYVPHQVVRNSSHAQELHQKLVSDGAEGSILRKPGSFYVASRSDALLKIKDQSEEDAYIIDWDEGKGRNTGKLGAIWGKWIDPEMIKEKYDLSVLPTELFRVGGGFTDQDRCDIGYAPQVYPKGEIIKVGFFGLQNSGKPRHPSFKGIREL